MIPPEPAVLSNMLPTRLHEYLLVLRFLTEAKVPLTAVYSMFKLEIMHFVCAHVCV